MDRLEVYPWVRINPRLESVSPGILTGTCRLVYLHDTIAPGLLGKFWGLDK